MKIVTLSPEMSPYAKTGGLADVTGSLTRQLQQLGHHVSVFIPRYRSVDLSRFRFELVLDSVRVALGNETETGRLFRARDDKGVTIYAVDNPDYFMRDQLYGTAVGDYPDNDRRFTFFQKAVLESMRQLGMTADILHCNDWQTGLVPVFLRTIYAGEPLFRKTKTVFTIHNLGYQGNFPPDSLPLTGLGWDMYKLERLEFYGKISFLKGGLVYADSLTTVSERYAQEVQTKDSGCGLEGVLRARKDKMHGVLNGIDYEEWNPETDPDIAAHYGLNRVEKKWINKNALQKENDFRIDPSIPLVGLISRLVDQKGLDILIPAMERFPDFGVQFVLLGTGEEKYHRILRDIAKKNLETFGIHIVFDSKMAKRIYAGADMLLLPSVYEPCGLGQMIALRYGTVPIGRETGGLADTIADFEPVTGRGNGFLFREHSTANLLEAIERALAVYRDAARWKRLVTNAMASDFSWTASAKRYVEIFRELAGGRRAVD